MTKHGITLTVFTTLDTNSFSPMVSYTKTRQNGFDPPPCERCGRNADEVERCLSAHHVYPRQYEFGQHIADQCIILCRGCHDDLETIIRYHERQHGSGDGRSELPRYQYAHLALDFIT